MINHWLVIFMELKELEEQRDREVTGFFWLGLQIAFIFGIPAFIAVTTGRKLVERFDNNNILIVCLVIAFIFSWLQFNKKSS